MIKRNISLKKLNTFGLDLKADRMITVRTEEEAVRMIRRGKITAGPSLVIGGGSNLLFVSDFNGTLIRSVMSDISVEKKNSENIIVEAGAGVNWDSFVGWCVASGYGGVENLSYIPGNAGAVPVQNIGAYGVEAKDTVSAVRAVSLETGESVVFSAGDCRFGYRESIFKGELKGKYLITSVSFRLTLNPQFSTNYGSLNAEIERLGAPSLKTIREAVISIRKSKLPDPAKTGNAGSFFKNPVVSDEKASEIKRENPAMPSYPDVSGRTKLAAGWLIEQCGWKGKRIGDAGVHENQALVLVNYGKAKGIEIYNLSEMIKASVYERFGISLQREVEVIGTI